MHVSVIVLTYNRSDALLAVLRSLASQCTLGDEIVIADDGSRAEHVMAIQACLPLFRCSVQHVWHPDVGFTAARARNLGVAHSKNDYLVFLDGDCVPHAHCIAQHRRLAQQGHFVNGSRVLLSATLTAQILQRNLVPEAWAWLKWVWLTLSGQANKCLWLIGLLVHWPLDFLRLKRKFVWRGIRSCNFAVWRRDFEAVNGFDETFAGWGHEDADLVLRLHHAGLVRKNGFWATEVFHLHHPENTRQHELKNRAIVIDRMQSHITLAQAGLQQIDTSQVVIQHLSS
jgi:GT2 family glycosyltransferase